MCQVGRCEILSHNAWPVHLLLGPCRSSLALLLHACPCTTAPRLVQCALRTAACCTGWHVSQGIIHAVQSPVAWLLWAIGISIDTSMWAMPARHMEHTWPEVICAGLQLSCQLLALLTVHAFTTLTLFTAALVP